MIWNQKSQLAGVSSDLRFGVVREEVMTWAREEKNKTENKNRKYQEQRPKSFWLPD